MPPWAETYWLGKQVVKCPMDLWVYQELIVERQPYVILETGMSGGGSAFFFATICDLIDHGHIVTVDTVPYPQLYKNHPRITYLAGDSVSELILAAMRRHLGPRCSVMVSLDSAHTYEHVGRELAAYGPLVTTGQYLVVEDVGVVDWGTPLADGSGALSEYLVQHPEFTRDRIRERHLMTSNVWVERV